MPISKYRLRWPSFRFRISTLLVAILFFSIFLFWVGRDLIRQRIQRPIIARIEQAGGRVLFEHQINGNSLEAKPRGSAVTRFIFGDDIFAKVHTIYFEQNVTDEDIQDLYRLESVQDLSINNGAGVTDDSVESLLKIRNLKVLYLRDTSISANGFSKLVRLPLTGLVINGSQFDDSHAKSLPELQKLETLQLLRASITDDGLKSIGQLTSLRQLDLWRCQSVSDNGVQKLAGLTKLETLNLMYCPLSDAGLSGIAKLHQLKHLTLTASNTGKRFDQLESLKQLEQLELADTLVDDRAMKTIGRFQNLRRLQLHGTLISDEGLSELVDLKKLVFLDIKSTAVTDKGLLELAKIGSLQFLFVERGSGISDEGLDALHEALPNCRIAGYTMDPTGGYMSKSWH